MFIDHYQYLNITIAVLIIEQREKICTWIMNLRAQSIIPFAQISTSSNFFGLTLEGL